jgi:hypothetical protein
MSEEGTLYYRLEAVPMQFQCKPHRHGNSHLTKFVRATVLVVLKTLTMQMKRKDNAECGLDATRNSTDG